MIRFFSDPHFGHFNILAYSDRPFKSIEEQDAAMWAPLAAAEEAGDALICLGDWSFHDAKVPPLKYPERHTLLFGNHDRNPKHYYTPWFRSFVGKQKTYKRHFAIQVDAGYKLLLSHDPMEDLQGCDYNVHGHIHNAYSRGDYPLPTWLATSDRHLNVSMECIGYAPKSLPELLAMRAKDLFALR